MFTIIALFVVLAVMLIAAHKYNDKRYVHAKRLDAWVADVPHKVRTKYWRQWYARHQLLCALEAKKKRYTRIGSAHRIRHKNRK